MVVCTRMGGMGNNMFQIATAIAYSLKHKMDYCISHKVIHPHYPANQDHSYNFQNLKYWDQELNLPVYSEQSYNYNEIPYMEDVCLQGYFQSYKYFNDYKKEIIKLFGFDDIETKEGVCSIHVRRGDYLDYPNHHPAVTMGYLVQAMTYIFYEGYRNFIFFSDDIRWCKDFVTEHEMKGIFRRTDITYSEGKTELEDMREMASCGSNITANSSFSYFGAYFNPNREKKIVMPSVWFGPELKNDTKDLYLPGSHII